MDRPRTSTALRAFIGCVNYYIDMCSSRAGLLKPLTDLSGMKTRAAITWTWDMEFAFF